MNNANYKNQTFLLLLEIIQISNILIMVAVTSREQIFGFFELVPARFGPRINCRISPGWTPLFGTRVLNSPIGLPAACASTVTLDELFLFYFFFPIHVVRKKHGLNVCFFLFFLMEGRFYIVIGEAKKISQTETQRRDLMYL